MLGRVSKWTAAVLAGLLLVGLVGFSTSLAQAPTPAAPQTWCLGPRGGLGFRWGGSMLDTLAEALGMTPQALSQAVQGGKTIAELAQAKQITIEQLVDKVLATRKAALQQAVQDKRITQAQMDAMLEQMRTRITQQLQDGTCTPGAGCRTRAGRWGSNGQPQQGSPASFGHPMMRFAPAGRSA